MSLNMFPNISNLFLIYSKNLFNKKNLQERIFFSAARNIVEDEPDQLNHSQNQLTNKKIKDCINKRNIFNFS